MTSTSSATASRTADLQNELAQIIERSTRGTRDHATAVAGLSFFRREGAEPPAVCLVEPSTVLVAQGAKRLIVGGEGYVYDTHRFLLTSLDLPANSEVVHASSAKPCVGLTLKLDVRLLAELIALGSLHPVQARDEKTIGVADVTEQMLEPIVRLVRLLEEPNAIPVLAPLILREIHYRLLLSNGAARLWQIVSVGSHSHRVARAVDWLKVNFAAPLQVEELAGTVQMSLSTFHHHFRQLTAMSPLQYQKWLRLNEARRLMLSEGADASTAAFQVGYESPSQFSREYSRLFGSPPRRDVDELRRQAEAGAPRQAL